MTHNNKRQALLEVCVEDCRGLEVAVQNGAGRIELCAALDQGGVTPSVGFVEVAAKAPLPVHVLIRPRGGDFVYRADEVDVMLRDIERVRNLGLAGVVIGAATQERRLDLPVLADMIAAAQGMDLTLHRVFDLLSDPFTGLEQAISLGFKRILTSGAAQDVGQGIELLFQLQQRAEERIALMPGGGLKPDLLPVLLEKGFRQFHASCRVSDAVDPDILRLGFAGKTIQRIEANRIRQYIGFFN
ncbi:copper homeostasis protein CutC [Allorhizobium sp. BGMRC 0089]|uniref:copper homeostasis protein CutC n=1 Tax=Allorhizobium sonneratiae TaxID=2934936 RepID=UPI0020336D65|nr:copper homeostasis protein CutC [Allorhizobium sonneratiae]MCM2293203.1 copper homeostasis protein CutC [Allorhizobium sonneratiae]